MGWTKTDTASITAADLHVAVFVKKIDDGYGGKQNALFARVHVTDTESVRLLLQDVGIHKAQVSLNAAHITAMQNNAATGDFAAVLKDILLPVALAALPLLGYTFV